MKAMNTNEENVDLVVDGKASKNKVFTNEEYRDLISALDEFQKKHNMKIIVQNFNVKGPPLNSDLENPTE